MLKSLLAAGEQEGKNVIAGFTDGEFTNRLHRVAAKNQSRSERIRQKAWRGIANP